MGAGHSSSQGAGAVACFCGPFGGISRSVAPVLLVTRPLKAEQSSGAVSWPRFVQGYVFRLPTSTG